jgi:hypothetical protein
MSASAANVGIACRRTEKEGAEAFPFASATTTADSERDARAARKLAYQTIGGALIPRMPSCPVEAVP